jgi:hypothetical protein
MEARTIILSDPFPKYLFIRSGQERDEGIRGDEREVEGEGEGEGEVEDEEDEDDDDDDDDDDDEDDDDDDDDGRETMPLL